MSFKRSLLASIFLPSVALFSIPVSCFGFANFAGGGVTLETEVRATYDSYLIGATSVGDDDYYASLRPQLRYVRKAGLAQLDGYVGVTVVRYNTYTEFDSEDFSAGLHSELPVDDGSRISGNVNLTYAESREIDYSVHDRIPTKSLGASLSLNYKLGLKMGLTETLTYANTNRTGYSDQTTFSNNLAFNYFNFLQGTTLSLGHGFIRTTSSGENALRAELDQTSNSLSASISRPIIGQLIGIATYGYRILDRSASESTEGQTTQKGSFYTFSLRGPFLPPSKFPKLQSSASITYEESKAPGINDLGTKTLTGNMSLSWAARERTDVSINANRSVDLTATDISVENTQVNFTVRERIGYATHLQAQVGNSWREYRGADRSDRTLSASLSAQHSLTRYWTTGASYTYQKNSTNSQNTAAPVGLGLRAFDYERHLLSIFVTNVF